jgi:hypothetical protein
LDKITSLDQLPAYVSAYLRAKPTIYIFQFVLGLFGKLIKLETFRPLLVRGGAEHSLLE